jgi:hypothetical protein
MFFEAGGSDISGFCVKNYTELRKICKIYFLIIGGDCGKYTSNYQR